MVVDTSALVAILLGEPDAARYARALEEAPSRLISAVSRVELSIVMESRKGDGGRADLDPFPGGPGGAVCADLAYSVWQSMRFPYRSP
ncbi:MAG: type II toxin-antitoxin system VapC family toxin, partial [Caulobacteraceae bacterium]